MKILYVDQTGQLGGGELSLFDWLNCSRENASVVLFSDGPFRTMLEEIGIPVEVLPLQALGFVRRESTLRARPSVLPAMWRLRRGLRKAASRADVLYANSQKAFLLSVFAKRRQQPLVWHLRDILTGEHFSPLLRRVAITASRFATVVLVNSEATAQAFIDAGGDKTKVRMAPDGVDPAPYDAVREEQALQLREEICPGRHFLVGLFGRLAEWKGQHILLDAVATLPDIHVCLVGDALFGEQAYAETLRQRAAMPDLAGRVHFLGFRKDIPELMKAMDLVVHASVAAEPLGRVIIEGMFARKPVIGTRAGGAAEIIEDGRSGLMVAPGSVSELRDAIEAIRTDPALAASLAAGGRQRAETTYSLAIMVGRVQAVLAALPVRTRSDQ